MTTSKQTRTVRHIANWFWSAPRSTDADHPFMPPRAASNSLGLGPNRRGGALAERSAHRRRGRQTSGCGRSGAVRQAHPDDLTRWSQMINDASNRNTSSAGHFPNTYPTSSRLRGFRAGLPASCDLPPRNALPSGEGPCVSQRSCLSDDRGSHPAPPPGPSLFHSACSVSAGTRPGRTWAHGNGATA